MNYKTLFTLLTLILSVFLFADPAMAQDTGGEVVESKSIIDFYKDGGPTMHVLLVGLIATVALTLYLFIAVSSGRMVPKKLVDNINVTMANKDIQGAYNLANATPCAYSKCISQALLKVNFDRDLSNKASMVVSAEDTLDQEETRVSGMINYLNTISTLAPMVGLFGTVIGMITAFGQLTSGKAEPSDLAGGIGTAMLTTAGGLLVGIPAMFFYFFFKNRLAALTTEIQKQFSYAIDVLSGEIQLQSTAQQTVEAAQEAAPE
ncbi:MAG: MotA/TolQ/ExbB proton channel family protein [Verrucomicrobiales bacterium]|nr:MotA/TolQ/ExbB proton channel family protein [Verrucomicrobiales bacterium]